MYLCWVVCGLAFSWAHLAAMSVRPLLVLKLLEYRPHALLHSRSMPTSPESRDSRHGGKPVDSLLGHVVLGWRDVLVPCREVENLGKGGIGLGDVAVYGGTGGYGGYGGTTSMCARYMGIMRITPCVSRVEQYLVYPRNPRNPP